MLWFCCLQFLMMCTHCLLSLEILRFAFQERPNLSVFYYLWLLSWYFRLTQTHCFNYLCFTGLETNKSCFDCFLKQSTWSLERVKIHLGLAGQLRAARSDHEPFLMMHKTSLPRLGWQHWLRAARCWVRGTRKALYQSITNFLGHPDPTGNQ